MQLILFTNDCHSGKCPWKISIRYQFSFCGVIITLVNHFYSWWQILHLLSRVSLGRNYRIKSRETSKLFSRYSQIQIAICTGLRFTLLGLFSSPFHKKLKLYFELHAERKDHVLSKKVVLEVDIYFIHNEDRYYP